MMSLGKPDVNTVAKEIRSSREVGRSRPASSSLIQPMRPSQKVTIRVSWFQANSEARVRNWMAYCPTVELSCLSRRSDEAADEACPERSKKLPKVRRLFTPRGGSPSKSFARQERNNKGNLCFVGGKLVSKDLEMNGTLVQDSATMLRIPVISWRQLSHLRDET